MAQAESIQDIISNAVSQAVQRVTPVIQKRIAELAAAELDTQLNATRKAVGRSGRGRRRARAAELTKWVADRRARRVPKFVIEMAGGLDTKKKFVAKYGENAAFEKGKPLPKPVK